MSAMALIDATNCHRAYAADGVSLGADFVSHIIDFRDMPMGSIQMLWSGAVALSGTFRIYSSNIPEVSAFDPAGTELENSSFALHAASGSRMWIRHRLAFRYALVRYTANGETGGTVDIVALGKKS